MHFCQALPDNTPQLKNAIQYALLNYGKAIRPLLVYGTGLLVGSHRTTLDNPATAVECLHVYSLIHDDLPAMDNDDHRRGKPSCHKAFGEAIAILAGDALQAWAFELLCNTPNISAQQCLTMIKTFSIASGLQGMVGGQALEFSLPDVPHTLAIIEDIHQRKTAALIQASVELGALTASDLSSEQYQCLQQFGYHLGLAYQIQDDLLDAEHETTALNYVLLTSIPEAQQRIQEHYSAAIAALKNFPPHSSDALRTIAAYIIHA
jgi:farnesyl diphosphate synthase